MSWKVDEEGTSSKLWREKAADARDGADGAEGEENGGGEAGEADGPCGMLCSG